MTRTFWRSGAAWSSSGRIAQQVFEMRCCSARRPPRGEPFLLAWGDHLSSSTARDGEGCIAQLLGCFGGLRSIASMHYLGSFGQFVLTPSIFPILRSDAQRHFVQSIDELRKQEGLDGVLIEGRRWDIGNIETYIEALQEQARASEDCQPPGKRARI